LSGIHTQCKGIQLGNFATAESELLIWPAGFISILSSTIDARRGHARVSSAYAGSGWTHRPLQQNSTTAYNVKLRSDSRQHQRSVTLTTYEDRGVSPHKPDVNAAISDIKSTNLFPGAFCWVVKDVLTGSNSKVLISHADGAGTKTSLAYIKYKETGDASVFNDIAQDSLAMNLDDMAAVGCFGPFLLSNTIGRNAKLISGDVIRHVIDGYKDQCERLAGYGISLEICGGETADMGDVVRTIVVDSTLSAMMNRADVIDCSRVAAGHAIVGLSSYGRAIHESKENSGVGTNGFTALRHDLLHSTYRDRYPETFAPEIYDTAYAGKFLLDEQPPHLGMTLGEALLSPTRIYSPILAQIVRECRNSISAIFHNSGGGQTKCLNFGHGMHYVKENLIPFPPIFELVRNETELSLKDIASTYNLGSRMEIVCRPDAVEDIIKIAKTFHVHAQQIGYTTTTSHKSELTILLGTEKAHFVR
jgi:phosphoribosylformylglycinamidine cyclo-ligase